MKYIPIYGILTALAALTLGFWVEPGWQSATLGCVVCFMAGVGSRKLDIERAGGGA